MTLIEDSKAWLRQCAFARLLSRHPLTAQCSIFLMDDPYLPADRSKLPKLIKQQPEGLLELEELFYNRWLGDDDDGIRKTAQRNDIYELSSDCRKSIKLFRDEALRAIELEKYMPAIYKVEVGLLDVIIKIPNSFPSPIALSFKNTSTLPYDKSPRGSIPPQQ